MKNYKFAQIITSVTTPFLNVNIMSLDNNVSAESAVCTGSFKINYLTDIDE